MIPVNELPTITSFTHPAKQIEQRRWLLWGMLTGAVTAFAAWWLQVPIYESTTLIHIAKQQPVVLQKLSSYPPSDQFSFDTFRRVQSQLATSDSVLKNALSPVDNLLPTKSNQVQWIKEHLRVTTSPDSEIMELKLWASDVYPNHLEIVLNAVQSAYLNEFAIRDKQTKDNHLQVIQSSLYRVQDELHSKENELDRYVTLSNKMNSNERFDVEKTEGFRIMQRAVENLSSSVDRLMAEMQIAKIELSAPSRVQLL